ncbi:hypothetical protein CL622_02375 [archaeon]|nr:hypothetical protein [archaeon]
MQNKKENLKILEVLGYLFAYLLFTTILFFVLTFLNKLPGDWNYFYVMGMTFIIAVVGYLLKGWLN